jgi:hypothetical protein
MRGSLFDVVVAVPDTLIQSCVLESWKVIWTSLFFSRSSNFFEFLFAMNRKSGPVRLATAIERPTAPGFVRHCFDWTSSESYLPTPFLYVFRIPIFLPSTNSKNCLICWSLGVSLSYCFETDGSVCELTSLWWSVSGILNLAVVEKALRVDWRCEMWFGFRMQRNCRTLEAQAARTNTLGADMAKVEIDVTVRSELQRCQKKGSSANPSGLMEVV